MLMWLPVAAADDALLRYHEAARASGEERVRLLSDEMQLTIF
jgi:hypothetical protein